MKILTLSLLIFLCNKTFSLKSPGPLVYVVTPSSKSWIDEGRSAPQPFYYHNWMRRIDSAQNTQNITTSTTTTAPKVKTPDLIFAEFESDKMKNIRKLLEKERIQSKSTTTTSKPIYVPEEEAQFVPAEPQDQHNFGSPSIKNEVTTQEKDKTDYFALYNNMYENDNAPPVFLPTTTTTQRPTSRKSTTQKPTTQKMTMKTYTTTRVPPVPVENIWHIIDSQKQDQYSEQWNEVPIASDDIKKMEAKQEPHEDIPLENTEEDEVKIDENFALPGFGTNSGIGGENESRAIRTEPNIRFPYVNLKPFQMKNLKKPHYDVFSNSKKGNNNNMFTSLDNFVDIKNPVRGEAQDVVNMVPMRHPIDRYNPAQPYLPDYGKIKQSSPNITPMKAVANLVPPPLPLPPKVTDNDFPAPSTYEQFPPFAPSDSAPPPTAPKPMYQPPMETAPDSGPNDSDDDGPPMDLGYRYKPPSAPVSSFIPTLPPLQKPAGGYSYGKPGGYSYDKPSMTAEGPPTDSDFPGYHYNRPDSMPEKPNFSSYHEASPPKDSPSYSPDYPDLIFDKPHGGMGDMKGSGMKGGDDDMGMMPPPPPMPDAKPGPPDDSGFPHDFPGDFKYHHDFDDHDHDFHHYHHHTTTTTTTTEMPRVNRYSYYYLGKKLYYLPLYFSVYFIVYVGALIIKAVLRHKIVYPNSWRPNDQTAGFFSKRSVDDWDSRENLHDLTGRVTRAIATAAERYMKSKKDN